jgi:tetratricopeptide (TPR) repeat protein
VFQEGTSQFYNLIGPSQTHISTTQSQNKTASDFIAAGRILMDRRTTRDCDRAIECLENAIAADPSSAQAYAFLAIARIGRSFLGGKPELAQLAEASARKATELDPKQGVAHRALAMISEQRGNFINAREEVFRAIELDGVDERSAGRLVSIAKGLGRPDVALTWRGIVRHLQNQPATTDFGMGDCWADLCDDERAEQAYRETMALRPELPEGWIGMCRLRLLERDFDSALQICWEKKKDFPQFAFTSQIVAQVHFFARQFAEAKKIYAELALRDPNGGGNFFGAISYESALGRLHLATGEKEAGLSILGTALQHELAALAIAPRHPEILYRTAAIESTLGLKNRALDHLRAAAAEGWIDFRSLGLDPRFDALRDEASFKEISESMKTRVASLRRSTPTD